MKSYLLQFAVAALLFGSAEGLATGPALPPNSLPQEQMRIEEGKTGPLVAVRNFGRSQEYYYVAEFEFKLADYKAQAGEHIAFGIGNLYPFYDKRQGVQGEGFVIGQWSGCPEFPIVIAFETYAGAYPVSSESCYGPIERDVFYKVVFKFKPDVFVEMQLWEVESGKLLHSLAKPVTLQQAGTYPLGLFIIPVDLNLGSGAYKLRNLKVFSRKDFEIPVSGSIFSF